MLASGLGAELDGPDAGAMLEIRSALVPEKPVVTGIEIDGARATLSIEGVVEGQTVRGTISFVEEANAWKVLKEDWNVDLTMSFPAPDVNLALEYAAKPKSPPRPSARIDAHEGTVTALAFTRDGERVVSIGYGDYRLCLWNPAIGQIVDEVKLEHRPNDMALLPDGSSAYVVDTQGQVTEWPIDWQGFGESRVLAGLAGETPRIAVDASGRRAVTTSWNDLAKLWDLDAGTFVSALPNSDRMRGVAFSPTASIVAAGNHANFFAVWNLEKPSRPSHKKYKVPKVSEQSDVHTIAFSPDGRRLATGHMDSSISIWDMEKRRQLHNWYVTDAATWDVTFSPCGTVLATAQQNGKVFLWEVETQRLIHTIAAHTGAAVSVAFNPADGVTLATGGEDGAICIWR
jgi:WD40 repeat protein